MIESEKRVIEELFRNVQGLSLSNASIFNEVEALERNNEIIPIEIRDAY